MKRLTIVLSIGLWLAGCAGPLGILRNPKVSHDPRSAHAEADVNDDGFVDVEELHLRVTEVYFHGDKDKDGYMAYEEMDEMAVFREPWDEVDSNDDGRVSLHEFVRDRMLDFHDVDSNDDGLLSVDEVVESYGEDQP